MTKGLGSRTCSFGPFPMGITSTGRRIGLQLEYLVHDLPEGLPPADRALLELAREASARAYAPYSRFLVGAALRMEDGTVVTGNNQENASFPAGICAERTALHAAMSQWPEGRVVEMAIAVPQVKGDRAVSPCGICRQALLEQELRQGSPIRLLLVGAGPVFELERAGSLLPLSFDGSFL
jgi:cytidine deaminase